MGVDACAMCFFFSRLVFFLFPGSSFFFMEPKMLSLDYNSLVHVLAHDLASVYSHRAICHAAKSALDANMLKIIVCELEELVDPNVNWTKLLGLSVNDKVKLKEALNGILRVQGGTRNKYASDSTIKGALATGRRFKLQSMLRNMPTLWLGHGIIVTKSGDVLSISLGEDGQQYAWPVSIKEGNRPLYKDVGTREKYLYYSRVCGIKYIVQRDPFPEVSLVDFAASVCNTANGRSIRHLLHAVNKK